MKASDLTKYVLNSPKKERTFVWATVAKVSPLEIVLFGGAAKLHPTAVAVPEPLAPGQRVYCCWEGTNLTIIGVDPETTKLPKLLAWGARGDHKTAVNTETPYLEVRAEVQAGRHYELRLDNACWRVSTANGFGLVYLRGGLIPVSTTSPRYAYTVVTSSSVSYGRQNPVTFLADAAPTESGTFGALVSFNSINSGMTMDMYSARLGIYDMGPAIPNTGIAR